MGLLKRVCYYTYLSVYGCLDKELREGGSAGLGGGIGVRCVEDTPKEKLQDTK